MLAIHVQWYTLWKFSMVRFITTMINFLDTNFCSSLIPIVMKHSDKAIYGTKGFFLAHNS